LCAGVIVYTGRRRIFVIWMLSRPTVLSITFLSFDPRCGDNCSADSSQRTSGNVHSKVIRAGRVGVIAVAVLAVTVVVNAVAGVQAVFGTVEGERESAGLDGIVSSAASASITANKLERFSPSSTPCALRE